MPVGVNPATRAINPRNYAVGAIRAPWNWSCWKVISDGVHQNHSLVFVTSKAFDANGSNRQASNRTLKFSQFLG